MSLKQPNIVIVDCQTNGSAPAKSQMIELAWLTDAYTSTACENRPDITSSLIALRPDQKVSGRILGMTGISAEELAAADPEDIVGRRFLAGLPEKPVFVAHYARFEAGFLRPWLLPAGSDHPFLCTFEIARRLYPDLPSRSIRAVSGYLGLHVDETKRSAHHVEATLFIWRKLADELQARNIATLDDLRSFLAAPAPKTSRKRYVLSPEVRLSLPDQPGIYKMLGHDGRVLYVGKATSLRNRVNSYFRGQKTKGSRLNELVSQIARVDFQVAGCPMEAALMESDAIKELNPPYNRAQKSGSRAIGFSDCEFRPYDAPSEVGRQRIFGPFSSLRQLQHLHELRSAIDSLPAHDPLNVIHLQELGAEADVIIQGIVLFRASCAASRDNSIDWRRTLCRSWRESILHARNRRMEALAAESTTDAVEDQTEEQADVPAETDEDFVWRPEDISRYVAGAFTGFAHGIHRGRWLNALANCNLRWTDKSTGFTRHVRITGGKYQFSDSAGPAQTNEHEQRFPVSDLATYDRMQVLMSELRRLLREGHQVELKLGTSRRLTNRQIMTYVFPGDFLPDVEAAT